MKNKTVIHVKHPTIHPTIYNPMSNPSKPYNINAFFNFFPSLIFFGLEV